MCGITGYLQVGGLERGWERSITLMTNALIHRGPDAIGTWGDPDAGIALGHRRLSVLDLSCLGDQPMISPSGRYQIAFNGEIYNFRELRNELVQAGVGFRGTSDTEVLLAGFDEWGIEATIQRSVGMFAFAVWDTRSRQLCLGRDRFGEKPLYCAWFGNSFVFASELKSCQLHPGWHSRINRDALSLYMRHGYVPGPYTIFESAQKVLPGELWWIDPAQPNTIRPEPYWSVESSVVESLNDPFRGTYNDAVSAIDTQLRETLSQQMISDVPLGAFLSGGIDSSLIVAMMQTLSDQRIKTFTMGFDDAKYDESSAAQAIADHIGTAHTMVQVTAKDALEVIPSLPFIYDEPFADSSQIPTALVARIARSAVTVALSGDGGDELFGGYSRYRWAELLWKKMDRLPVSMRKAVAGAIRMLPPERWNALVLSGRAPIPQRLRDPMAGDKLYKIAELFTERTSRSLYRQLVSLWTNPEALVLRSSETPTALTSRSIPASISGFTEQMMYLDAQSYLPDDILVKVDRSAMSVSLETRSPYLDHRLFHLAWRLPFEYKVSEGLGKRVIRDVLAQYIPQSMFDRPKQGFSVPVAQWLRGPLREWAEDLLEPNQLASQGYLDVAQVRAIWSEHLSGHRNWQARLWSVLMFQSWLSKQELQQ